MTIEARGEDKIFNGQNRRKKEISYLSGDWDKEEEEVKTRSREVEDQKHWGAMELKSFKAESTDNSLKYFRAVKDKNIFGYDHKKVTNDEWHLRDRDQNRDREKSQIAKNKRRKWKQYVHKI